MPRRIDVELTSRRDDGTWTWRAAGAREPKGTVDASLLPADANAGMVLKAEVEIDIEGIVVTAVTPPKSARAEPNRLEIIGRSPSEDSLVTTTLVRRGRGDRAGGGRRDREDRPDRADRGGRGDRGPRPGGDRGGRGRDGARPARADGGPGEQRRRPPFERKAPLEPKPKAKRLRAGRVHRNALIATLPAEHKPIAEELFRGGPPAVRTALDKQNEGAKTEGRPEIDPAPLMLLAERLWPQVRSAEWQDRAEGALADVDELDLRDLRSVVVAADSAARDDTTREMATRLREALNRRVEEEHSKWLVELAELVADGRVVGALRRSSRPPKAGAPLPAELAATLATQTSEALNAEVTPDRWAVVLDALSFSPVRTSVTPISVPEDRPEELLAAVRKSAARLPAIAALFGVEAETTPVGTRGRRAGRPSGRSAPASATKPASVGGPRIPPPPTLGTDRPAAETPATETAAAETPAAETAAADNPAEVVAEGAPAPDETTASAVAAGEPAGETAATETPATETPATETPATETPATETSSAVEDVADVPAAGSSPE